MTVVFNQAPPAELVEKHAAELATNIGGGTDATKSQLRRFYQEYTMIRQRIKASPDREEAFASNLVALKMLIAKAEYARSRYKVTKIPDAFINWFTGNIKAIHCAKDMECFGDYFEAFIGYFYAVAASRSTASYGGRR